MKSFSNFVVFESWLQTFSRGDTRKLGNFTAVEIAELNCFWNIAVLLLFIVWKISVCMKLSLNNWREYYQMCCDWKSFSLDIYFIISHWENPNWIFIAENWIFKITSANIDLSACNGDGNCDRLKVFYLLVLRWNNKTRNMFHISTFAVEADENKICITKFSS